MTGQELMDFFVDYWRDIVSVLGFALTIWALVTARSAKAAAREAREAAQKSYAKADTIATLSIAVVSIDRVCQLQEQQLWDRVPELYRSIRQSLAKVIGEGSSLRTEDQKYVRAAIVNLAQMAEFIDEKRKTQVLVIEAMPQLNREISKYADEFTRMNQELQRRQE